MSTPVNVPSSENEDDYTIMGTIVEPSMNKMSINLTHIHLVKIGIHKMDSVLFTQPYKVNKMPKTRFHKQILHLNLLHFLLLVSGPGLLQSP